MNLLTIENLTKSYTDKILLNQISFSIQEGEKIGVIGVNGTGKSTLLKIITGEEHPDSGSLVTANHVKIGYLPQNPLFEPEHSVLEAAVGRDSLSDMARVSQAKSMCNRLGMTDFDAPVGSQSGGQKKRIALVRVLLNPVDILVLDEPTNHLDNAMNSWLEDYLISMKTALVMVTHDRYFLDRISNRIVEIDRGALYSYPGNYSEYVRLKEARLDSAAASERKRQSILRTELAWLARGARARSTKQKAHIDRIRALQEQSAPESLSSVEMSSVSSRLGRQTLEAEHLSKSYGDHLLFSDFNYIFLKNDRIGIIGPNGCGKSTLLNILTGQVKPDSGSVTTGQTVRIGYFSQENEDMDEQQKVIDYIRDVAEFVQTPEGPVSCSKMLERFLFDGSLQWSPISKLSGGERRRLYLLRVLMGAPNLLILDEPTNDLDIQTLTILEDYLDSFSGIVITVSHDRYFLDRVVRRLFSFEGQGRIRQYEGGYSDYLIARDIRPSEEADQTAGPKPEKTKTERIRPQKLKFSYREQREYEHIEDEIAELEEQCAALEEAIGQAATDYQKLRELMAQKEDTERQLEFKLSRWEYLTNLAEQIEQEQSR